MLYQEQGHTNGRGSTMGLLCADKQQMGLLEGNTFHGSILLDLSRKIIKII
jgi:hypothetical protein